jgi:hypothetical protein
VLAVALMASFVSVASAKSESADLRREIASQLAGVSDLERLDERHAVTDELTLLRTWVDEARGQLAKENFDRVREVIDRCIAEAELIRQKITTSKMVAHAADREAALKHSRERVEKTRQALQQALITKKAMELNSK